MGKARGKYIARMDADDISLPNRLEDQVKYLEDNPDISICGTNVTYLNEKGIETPLLRDNFPLTHEYIKAGLMFYCFIRHPTVMLKKDIMEEYNLMYDGDFNSSEDFELWSRACHYIKFANMQQVLLKYRFHSSNYTGLRKNEGANNYKKVMMDSFRRLEITFSSEELQLLCPLTCEINELNKKHVIEILQACAQKIREANRIKHVYENEALEYALELRMGWTKHKYRHKVITVIRKIAKFINPYNNVSFVIDKFSSHLELYGVVSTLKQLYIALVSSERRRYFYEKRKSSDNN
nr:glycosyltransferase [Paenibacillus ginsengarvi]